MGWLSVLVYRVSPCHRRLHPSVSRISIKCWRWRVWEPFSPALPPNTSCFQLETPIRSWNLFDGDNKLPIYFAFTFFRSETGWIAVVWKSCHWNQWICLDCIPVASTKHSRPCERHREATWPKVPGIDGEDFWKVVWNCFGCGWLRWDFWKDFSCSTFNWSIFRISYKVKSNTTTQMSTSDSPLCSLECGSHRLLCFGSDFRGEHP